MNNYQPYPWQFEVPERPVPSLRKPTASLGAAQVFFMLVMTALLSAGLVLGIEKGFDYFQARPVIDAQARGHAARRSGGR